MMYHAVESLLKREYFKKHPEKQQESPKTLAALQKVKHPRLLFIFCHGGEVCSTYSRGGNSSTPIEIIDSESSYFNTKTGEMALTTLDYMIVNPTVSEMQTVLGSIPSYMYAPEKDWGRIQILVQDDNVTAVLTETWMTVVKFDLSALPIDEDEEFYENAMEGFMLEQRYSIEEVEFTPLTN